MHALVVHRGGASLSVEGSQVQGFGMYAADLRRHLGLSVEMVAARTLADIEETVRSRPADLAFLMVGWDESPEVVEATFRRLSAISARPKLIFLDYYAPASSPHFGVLPFVDCYFKRQAYRDLSLYLRDFGGGNIFTDRLGGEIGIDLDGWFFGSKPRPADLSKVVVGWNLGVTRQYRQLLRLGRHMPLPWERRPFALNCRLGLSPGARAKTEWYHRYRELGIRAASPLFKEFRCTGTDRVGLRQYIAEMILSKIAFSPFGWGEVCFRDFEAVAAGALLVKPSMDHIQTSPNLYVEGKTYVPCSWDMSDVPDICRYYLAHPEQAKEIIHNAQEILHHYYEDGGFVDDVGRIMAHVGFQYERSPSPIESSFALAWN